MDDEKDTYKIFCELFRRNSREERRRRLAEHTPGLAKILGGEQGTNCRACPSKEASDE